MIDTFKRFFIRLKYWEYWPVYVVNLPVIIIVVVYAVRARSLTFFSKVNPAIPTGGLFGESKMEIYKLLPTHLYPKTECVHPSEQLDAFAEAADEKRLFPLIAKPDVGERGYRVEFINNKDQLLAYHDESKYPYLIQNYVDYPVELSVVAYYLPDGSERGVTSLCYKESLSVTGDGLSTLDQLIGNSPRAFLHLPRLIDTWAGRMSEIITEGEVILLDAIGNHSRGSTFLDWNHKINVSITNYFTDILTQMDGVYFGRFDVKCASVADFIKGYNIQVIEFNGVGGEPAHVYDPTNSFWKMIKDMHVHWGYIYKISTLLKDTGSIDSFHKLVRFYRAYSRKVKST